MNEKGILNNLKTIYLFALTILVFINTCVLAYTIPIIGNHIMPENQAVAELWEVVTLAMQGCIAVIIMCCVAYGVVKVFKKLEVKND